MTATPRAAVRRRATVPAMRSALRRSARALLELGRPTLGRGAARRCELRDGKIITPRSNRTLTFAELAHSEELPQGASNKPRFRERLDAGRPIGKCMGTSVPRPNCARPRHRHAPLSLRHQAARHAPTARCCVPPSYGAKLVSIDLAPAKEMKVWSWCRTATSSASLRRPPSRREQALEAIAKTAKWEPRRTRRARMSLITCDRRVRGGVPKNEFAEELAAGRSSRCAPPITRPTSSTRRWRRAPRWPSGRTAS